MSSPPDPPPPEPTQAPRPPRQRLFLALWPDVATRDALAAVARKALRRNGRLVAPERVHLTLAFLGSVEAPVRARLEAELAGVRAERFTLALERLGQFARARVAWVAPLETPPALGALAAAVADALRRAGIEPERRPFHAHVTVARRVSQRLDIMTIERIEWAVDAFHLVESRTLREGALYRTLATWPLA